jgi:hypothetical protein
MQLFYSSHLGNLSFRNLKFQEFNLLEISLLQIYHKSINAFTKLLELKKMRILKKSKKLI